MKESEIYKYVDPADVAAVVADPGFTPSPGQVASTHGTVIGMLDGKLVVVLKTYGE